MLYRVHIAWAGFELTTLVVMGRGFLLKARTVEQLTFLARHGYLFCDECHSMSRHRLSRLFENLRLWKRGVVRKLAAEVGVLSALLYYLVNRQFFLSLYTNIQDLDALSVKYCNITFSCLVTKNFRIVIMCFIGGGNRSIPGKPPACNCQRQESNLEHWLSM
jgi:hypothetical protein